MTVGLLRRAPGPGMPPGAVAPEGESVAPHPGVVPKQDSPGAGLRDADLNRRYRWRAACDSGAQENLALSATRSVGQQISAHPVRRIELEPELAAASILQSSTLTWIAPVLGRSGIVSPNPLAPDLKSACRVWRRRATMAIQAQVPKRYTDPARSAFRVFPDLPGTDDTAGVDSTSGREKSLIKRAGGSRGGRRRGCSSSRHCCERERAIGRAATPRRRSRPCCLCSRAKAGRAMNRLAAGARIRFGPRPHSSGPVAPLFGSIGQCRRKGISRGHTCACEHRAPESPAKTWGSRWPNAHRSPVCRACRCSKC